MPETISMIIVSYALFFIAGYIIGKKVGHKDGEFDSIPRG